MDQNLDFVCEDCAKNDYPFYLLTLFQRPEKRGRLWAVGALRLQLENIIANMTQETLAYMRLTWWRDEIAKLPEGKGAKGQPILVALTETLPVLPIENLQDYINSFEQLIEGESGNHRELFDALIEKILNDEKSFARYQKQNAVVTRLTDKYRSTKWQDHPPLLALRLWLIR